MEKVAEPLKIDKREAILQAALELVAEKGLPNTSMALISKQARASAGVIYHYFESKDELLQTLYLRIKADMGRAWLRADDPHQPLAHRFQALWLAIFHYSLDHQLEMAFLEQYESLPGTKQQENQTLNGLIDELQAQDIVKSLPLEGQALYRLIADLQTQGLLKDLPLAVIGEFTLGVALRLARQVNAGQVNLAPANLNLIAQACWDAISR